MGTLGLTPQVQSQLVCPTYPRPPIPMSIMTMARGSQEWAKISCNVGLSENQPRLPSSCVGPEKLPSLEVVTGCAVWCPVDGQVSTLTRLELVSIIHYPDMRGVGHSLWSDLFMGWLLSCSLIGTVCPVGGIHVLGKMTHHTK